MTTIKKVIVLVLFSTLSSVSAWAQHSEHAEGVIDKEKGKHGIHRFEIGLAYTAEKALGGAIGYFLDHHNKLQFTANFNGDYYSALYLYELPIYGHHLNAVFGGGVAGEREEEDVMHHGETASETEWSCLVEAKAGVQYNVSKHFGLTVSTLPHYNTTKSDFGIGGEFELVYYF
ncbi:hypothetical protein FUAX_08280 [Fulvitalea axinellae]|uniref:Outer membrane protein beta-barrel domain-containing protein n=1 Tax=Fulvitalea axinellae TaxID=1182444 RepID=A0AAU9D6E7_9BACT|nr:hypothetical protein FUAX_08280 [Fulvitalea axinellae]